MTLLAKMLQHVRHDEPGHNGTPCWVWLRSTRAKGYGQQWYQSRNRPAHIVAYELSVGPVPAGLVLDHLCRNHACINPAHLEPVTNRENILRGTGRVAAQAGKTHCPKGHPYSGENLYVKPTGSRQCRTCKRLADKARQ